MNINRRVEMLRKEMEAKGLDAYVVNTSDPHSSEYIADRYKVREWISGFTGSAGTAVITKDAANLWTDGRYFIQAEKELATSEFELYKEDIDGYPTYQEWLNENLDDGDRLGIIGEIYSQGDYEVLKKSFGYKDIEIIDEYDLFDEIWEDRPEIPASQAFLHEINYTGKTSGEKIEEVREMMKKKGASYYLFSSLDDVAWLYNIRGRDISHSPVVTSYGLVSEDNAYIFVNARRLSKEILADFKKNDINILSYEGIMDKISSLNRNKRLYLDKYKMNRLVYSSIPEGMEVINGINFTTMLKAVKSDVEIKNQKNAYIKDGVALTKFLYWLDETIGKEEITELSADKKLLSFRKEQEDFIEPSFSTISAYGENAAMMHYRATEETSVEMKPKGLYLVDSGGQYLDGTTDITRTIALGELTDEEKKDYTLTLKSHIKLSGAKFLYGATGHVLDVIARYPMWQEGLDYKCGTGHGIGYLLNVHEGPHRIARAENSVALEDGMITSIEPGVYKDGKHGIRIENIVVVKKDIKTDSGQFMKFENLSFVPIDTTPLDRELLSEDEIKWLNEYHDEVYEKLEEFLNEEERSWLKSKTQHI